MKLYVFLITAISCLNGRPAKAAEHVWFNGQQPVSIAISTPTSKVVKTACDMFSGDMLAVTGKKTVNANDKQAAILIFQLDLANKKVKKQLQKRKVPVDKLLKQRDAFYVGISKGQLLVVGNNGRGTAYGLLELSRKAGVSPWIWWADNTPERKNRLTIDDHWSTYQAPSIERRGIFINDEDWSIAVWSSETFEPGHVSEKPFNKSRRIGKQTYKKIFQLLLRLRANMIWPAMHEVSVPFYHTPGAKEMADSCGIIVGTSHCEPMMRNSATEWKPLNIGDYNYLTNGESIRQYWQNRLDETCGTENVFTIGMRGLHDGNMIGPKTMKEKTYWLQKVIDDQIEMLRQAGKATAPTAFVPYKEVLEIYENGLNVPDETTLIWCDDNYGYLTRLPDSLQQMQKGGNGIYYHLSYWGRPHDYLWLTTTQPGLIYQELREAYEHNVRKQWIANVHDPKVASYDLELFLDMAWNYGALKPNTLNLHLENWLKREFGDKTGNKLLPVMQEYYRLTAIRKPEFMGWNQTELDKRKYTRGISPVQDTELSFTEFGSEADRYISDYRKIMQEVDEIGKKIPPAQQDAYMSHIRYRVTAAGLMAVKQLEAQRARQIVSGEITTSSASDSINTLKKAEATSLQSHEEIQRLTREYNEMNHGKWNKIMSCNPRDLFVFHAPTLPDTVVDKSWRNEKRDNLYQQTKERKYSQQNEGVISLSASQWEKASEKLVPIQMLGHSMQAVPLPKGAWLQYDIEAPNEGSYTLRLALVPTQPNDKGDLRFSVSIDDEEAQVFSLKEPYRSECWKLNVLRGQARRDIPLQLKAGQHKIVVKALDEHIILDQLLLDTKANRSFYLFPTS